jgi:hypothetical protein
MPKASLNCRFLTSVRNDSGKRYDPQSGPISVIPAKAGIHVHRDETAEDPPEGARYLRQPSAVRNGPRIKSGVTGTEENRIRPAFCRHPSPCAGTRRGQRPLPQRGRKLVPVGAACSRDATVAFAEAADSMAESVRFAVIPAHAPALVAARGRSHSGAEDCPCGSGLQPRCDRGVCTTSRFNWRRLLDEAAPRRKNI